MRTLKKTLSLVLVVAMVLGLCVVGASAKNAVDDFTDADKIGDAYYEAVGVMTGIGVIKGMGDGTLSPTGNYTRAQAAKIITYMLIGEKAAESLVCTTAPFEDVAANHWAAGYIAFCVEKGIINGMSATTFDPEGQLTGFQWAKMLLCAVGFGSQGEFTGNSWSLNTAFVAHRVGLFDGDLAGADHVALQRQQAILYAFNVLTTVPQVTYAPGITGYIEGVVNYKPVTDLGQTLGWSIYKLNSKTGVIVDNEGMGASVTYLDTTGKYSTADADLVKIAANTTVNQMYHAARIWYVAGAKANTGVFVMDLAKVETTECPTAAAAATNKKIGNEVSADVYQRDVVDNGDYGKVTVDYYYSFGSLGSRSEVNKTTNIGGLDIKNEDIMTDISAINKLDPIIYMGAYSVKEAKACAYYVYTPTATTGVVTKVENKTETITLRDGTELKKSALATGNLAPVLGQEYTFVLDTHGHVIRLAAVIDLVYFTGSYTRTFGTYVGEETYTAQVIDVVTGKFYDVPVVGRWNGGNDTLVGITGVAPGYYRLGSPTLDGFYRPTLWANAGTRAVPDLNSGLGYAHAWRANVRVSSTTDSIDTTTIGASNVSSNDYLYDPATVQFVIARATGSNLTVTTYNGVADLLANYGPVAASSVTLGTTQGSVGVVATYTTNAAGTNEVTTIFSVEGTYWSRYLFIPYDIAAADGAWANELGFGGTIWVYENAGYVNGNAVNVAANAPTSYERGFYAYTIDRDGYYWLAPVLPDEWAYEDEDIRLVGSAYYQVNKAGTRIAFASNVVILDVRSQVLAGKEDAIKTLPNLYDNFSKDYATPVQFAYTFNTDGDIAVLYIVDRNLGRVTLTKDNDWAEEKVWDIEDFECIRSGNHEYEDVVTFTLAPSDTYKLAEGAKVDVYLKLTDVDGSSITPITLKIPACTADKDGKVAVSFKTSDFKDSLGNPYSGDYWYDVEIADVLFPKFTVSLDSSIASKFDLTTAIDGDWKAEVEIDDLAPSQTFAIGFTRTTAAKLEATVKATGTPAASYTVTFNNAGEASVSYVPTKVENIVVTAIDAVITLDMGTSDQVPAMNFEFKNGLEGANYDKWTDTVTAGDTVAFVVKRSGEAIPSQYNGYRLKIFTDNSDPVLSVESVSKDSANGNADAEFTFTLKPGGNNVEFTNAEWTKEIQNSEGTVQG